MAYVKKIFNSNFLEYASYVIKDRAIPHLDDGLKPVQRRILHSLFEMDDGRFHKVANVVGHCMKYHPHGDASIFSALVVLANKDLFIDKQGNFGNIYTGDEASAARYIECRILPLAKEILYNPEITHYEDSYDGRNREPVTFPAKIPVLLVQGAEGIAVGMSTKILPHNFCEVIDAMIASLQGKKFSLYPDFPTGGLVDVSEYNDGMGKVRVRAKLDTKDPKRIVIRELPFGSTTESLINSIEAAARKNNIKIAAINDFTTEQVEIEIQLARGVQSKEVVDALFAFTDCESSISVNMLLIKDKHPVEMTITQVVEYHAKKLLSILKAELELEEGHLKDKLHARTLEQIFIEERIYKLIEKMATQEGVTQAVIKGFIPFASHIKREVTVEDVERLLKIPIRRISLYDINKAKKEMMEIKARLKEIKEKLSKLTAYAVDFLGTIKAKYEKEYQRKTKIVTFEKIDVREVAQRNLKLYYDEEKGYLGYGISGGTYLFDVSTFDRILVVRRSGVYSVINAPEKLFVDKGMFFCGYGDKDEIGKTVFSILYKDTKTGFPFIKRCRIETYILNKDYSIIPDNATILDLTDKENCMALINYKPQPRLRVLEEKFSIKDYLVKSVKSVGTRLSTKEVEAGSFVEASKKGGKKK